MDLAFALLIIALVCVSMPIVIVGGAWYFEFWKWSPFWNKRFSRPFYRGLIYDMGGNFVGYFVKTVKSVAGNPTLFTNKAWGSFARPNRPTQYFKHGVETRLIYRLDVSESGRWDNSHEPKELVFGDDPKTTRAMQEAKSIEKLTSTKRGPDYTLILMAILGVGLLAVIILAATGAFD